MALISPLTRLADAVIESPDIVPVINRFGIYLGLRDATVADLCSAAGVDVDFFLTILNTFVNEEYFPEHTLRTFSGALLVKYVEQTNRYYREFSLPNIERHFRLLIKESGSDSNVMRIFDFYNTVKSVLLNAQEADMTTWIPELLKLEESDGACGGVADRPIPDGTEVNDAINDLIMMFVRLLSGSADPNLTYGVLTALNTLARDVKQNNRIRDRILLPLYRELLSAGVN